MSTETNSIELQLYNTLSREKEEFIPLDRTNVRMYVCGPTVYSRPHIGNARSIVVYDILYRLLLQIYGKDNVTYARNITDVDDKINKAAIERNISIQQLTSEITELFHSDMAKLNTLQPNIEPKATEHISHIVNMIELLIANGYAYEAEGHVLFDTSKEPPKTSNWHYGMLSKRSTEDMQAGARVEVAPYKKNACDFVLWKPSPETDDESSKFDSPWGVGRPGWHIECSAMSTTHLGKNFDIHGGGADLMFPHHENEIAQSCCANIGSNYAKYWIHNGFLTVNGEKMSKSLNNFITVYELLEQGIKGETIRLALMSTHYRKPLDWNSKLVSDSKKQLDHLYRVIANNPQANQPDENIGKEFLTILADDINVVEAIAYLHKAPKSQLQPLGGIIGILQQSPDEWFRKTTDNSTKDTLGISEKEIEELINIRIEAKKQKDWAQADSIRNTLKEKGIILEDTPDGRTSWRIE